VSDFRKFCIYFVVVYLAMTIASWFGASFDMPSGLSGEPARIFLAAFAGCFCVAFCGGRRP